ncbi:hypothetical protein [Lewinella sp. IMCC34191]|uniref:hypothetical protein n=1 Tax=Lewinella sp. IMCC34191 TaxID=2259172 RepID=UPI000E23436D|nr:hypothetical protein [Lewinella sp. IMCC34191]
MKLGRALWSVGSLLINLTIVVHLIMARRMPVGDLSGRLAYVTKNWDIYSINWRIEWLLMAMIAAGAVFFATRTRILSWAIISVGQVLLLITYPVLLAGFVETSLPIASLAGRLATEIFVSGNILFLGGLGHLYLNDEIAAPWLRYPAAVLAILGTLAFVACNFGLVTLEEVTVAAPLLIVLHLVNSYYGLVVPLSRRGGSRRSSSSSSRRPAREPRVSMSRQDERAMRV